MVVGNHRSSWSSCCADRPPRATRVVRRMASSEVPFEPPSPAPAAPAPPEAPLAEHPRGRSRGTHVDQSHRCNPHLEDLLDALTKGNRPLGTTVKTFWRCLRSTPGYGPSHKWKGQSVAVLSALLRGGRHA